MFSITYHSVFITHNSKLMDSTERKSIGYVLKFCFHHSIIWFFSDELAKLKTTFWCFWVMKTELWWYFDKYTHIRDPWSESSQIHSDILLSPALHQRLHILSFFFFSCWVWAGFLYSFFFQFILGFLFFFFFFFTSHDLFSSFFPLLVLSKLYSVICCGVEGVGGVNGRICYSGLIWCFVICRVIFIFIFIFFSVGCWFWCLVSIVATITSFQRFTKPPTQIQKKKKNSLTCTVATLKEKYIGRKKESIFFFLFIKKNE